MGIEALNNLQNQVNSLGPQQGTQAPVQAEGKFMGHTVQVQNSPASLLADAAEELGFSVDKTKDYEVEERKQRDKSQINSDLLKLYQNLMHKVGKSQQMGTLVDSLKKADSKRGMQQALLQAFPDKTDAWAALGEAIEEFKNDPSVTDEQRTELESLYEEFTRDNEQAIRLGLRGALSGQDFPEVGDMDQTRDLYRNTVGEFSSVNEVFSEIKAHYGDNFDKAMDFLFSAISADINSETPTMEKTHLESVHSKLELVRLTQSAYKLCDDQMQRWSTEHGVKNSSLSTMDLLSEVVNLRGRNYLGAGDITPIVSKANPPDIEHEVLFTQDLLATVRKFPVALFDNEEGRMLVLDAVQAAVDDVITREDEFYASQE